jgi:hypothetical protein
MKTPIKLTPVIKNNEITKFKNPEINEKMQESIEYLMMTVKQKVDTIIDM